MKNLNKLIQLFLRHRELLLYLFFGGLTFVISIVTFAVFNISMNINEHTANIMSWTIAVLFSFFTNRIWVFAAPTDSIRTLIKQIIMFFCGRVATLIIEEIILFIFITWLGFSNMIIKIAAQIVVIVTNYIISKLIVFKG